MSFLYEIKQRKDEKYIEITGFEGSLRTLRIPENLEGLPVEAVANHAFSGRMDLTEVRIPDTVSKLGAFCFYDCRELKRLELTDAVVDYYDGVIRECKALEEICVHIRRGAYRVVKEMLEDNKEELHLRLLLEGSESDGPQAVVCLTIPPYHNEDREDTYARAIHPKIVGAGYAYRQTVTRTEVKYREYDRLFAKAALDEFGPASRIAFDRLMWPYDLTEEDAGAYRTYLSDHADQVLELLIRKQDRDRLEAFLSFAELEEEILTRAIDLSSELKRHELTGMLMAYNQSRFGSRREAETFSFDEF